MDGCVEGSFLVVLSGCRLASALRFSCTLVANDRWKGAKFCLGLEPLEGGIK